MEIIQETTEELQEDPVMLALVERQTLEDREAEQNELERRAIKGGIGLQKLALYGRGVIALTGRETDILFPRPIRGTI